MAERILSGKIKQLVYTTKELSQSPLSTTVIDNGVLVYEKTSSGQIKCKMGDGNNVWSGLEYIEDSDKMDKIDPIGIGSLSMNRAEGSIVGENSVALGTECFASGDASHAEGWISASGNYGKFSIDSSSIGNETINDKTMIYLEVSYSGDTFPILVGDSIYIYFGTDYSIKSSVQSISNTDNSHTYKLYVDEYESINSIINNMGSSFGVVIMYVDNNLEICKGSHAEGSLTIASGDDSHAEGYNTTASGKRSHAEGYNTTASGYTSHAEGYNTTASSDDSHAEGNGTTASGGNSHAEGNGTTASGGNSHAEGNGTTASGYASHSEGTDTTASRDASHAEGYNTTASGYASHAEGYNTTASGYASHAEGSGTIASSDYQHVQGEYNIKDTSGTYAHIVGGGDYFNRKNIHTLDWNGNAVFSGDVTATDSNGNTVSLLNSTINSDTIVSVSNGGTGYNTITDTTYTTARYRASSLNSSETTPTENGVIAWTYE